jgi:hypothetical protein
MNYATEMGSGVMVYISTFINSGTMVKVKKVKLSL